MTTEVSTGGALALAEPKKQDVQVQTSRGLQIVPIPELVKPRWMEEQEERQLQEKVDQLVQELLSAEVSGELQFLRRFSKLGADAETASIGALNLLNAKMSSISYVETGEKVTADIAELKVYLDQMNPISLQNEKTWWGFFKMFQRIPGAKRYLHAIRLYAARQDTFRAAIADVDRNLGLHYNILDQTAAELTVLSEDLDGASLGVEKNAYFAHLLMIAIRAEMERCANDPAYHDKLPILGDGIHAISTRGISLATAMNGFEQSKMGISLMARGILTYMNAIADLRNFGVTLLQVGAAIQVAMHMIRQAEQAINAVRGTIGEQLVANARMINDMANSLGDIEQNPLAPYQKIEEAHNLLLQASDTVERTKLETVNVAAERIPQMVELAREMRDRTETAQTHWTEPETARAAALEA